MSGYVGEIVGLATIVLRKPMAVVKPISQSRYRPYIQIILLNNALLLF